MIRETEEYRNMTPYMATAYAEGFEEAESEEQNHAAWQYLHDTRLAYTMQSAFGRMATHMIEAGVIEA